MSKRYYDNKVISTTNITVNRIINLTSYNHQQMPWENSDEQMNIPREMRIHVQRVFAIPHNMPPPPQDTMGPFAPPPPPQPREQNEVRVY